jgi:toxin ParE1/3/4
VPHKITFSEAALADLKSLFDYLDETADFDVAVANDAHIRMVCLSLADFPNRGRPRTEIQAGLRSMPFARSATIFYTVDIDEVRIVRVVHARRDLQAAFEGPL